MMLIHFCCQIQPEPLVSGKILKFKAFQRMDNAIWASVYVAMRAGLIALMAGPRGGQVQLSTTEANVNVCEYRALKHDDVRKPHNHQ